MQTLPGIPWGKDEIKLALPDSWTIDGIFEPRSLPGIADTQAEVERALSTPIGSPHLSEMVHSEMRIALVVDDSSRPTPVTKILPAVLAELQRGGARLENITLIPALGVHFAMTEEELAARTGPEWLAKLRWVSHNCDDPAQLADLGMTARGTPVLINKTVAEANLVVSIGCIEPHIIASFGGGYKNIIPGVASRATIAHNHSLNCTPDTFNMVGQPIERNPMRLDLEEGGRMLTPPVFIINAVLNSSQQVVKIVTGHPIHAHRAGVKVSAEIYGARIPGLADVVITSSNPMNEDLRQGVKALANTIRALKPGGVMLTLVQAEKGVGVFGLANKKLPVGRTVLSLLTPLLLPLVPKLKLKGMGEEDKFFLYFALQAMRHGKLFIYGPTIPAEIHERLPFVHFVGQPAEGILRAQQRFPNKAHVLVFPYGGSTYPIIEA